MTDVFFVKEKYTGFFVKIQRTVRPIISTSVVYLTVKNGIASCIMNRKRLFWGTGTPLPDLDKAK